MQDARSVYADIIDRERPVSEKHPPMSRLNRAAQFSPFAALTGYDDLIRESERVTDARAELDEGGKEVLDRKLLWLLRQKPGTEARFTYFVPDAKKAGGAYVTATGSILRYDPLSRSLLLDEGSEIPIDELRAVESEAFSEELW